MTRAAGQAHAPTWHTGTAWHRRRLPPASIPQVPATWGTRSGGGDRTEPPRSGPTRLEVGERLSFLPDGQTVAFQRWDDPIVRIVYAHTGPFSVSSQVTPSDPRRDSPHEWADARPELDDRTVRVWDLAMGSEVAMIESLTGPPSISGFPPQPALAGGRRLDGRGQGVDPGLRRARGDRTEPDHQRSERRGAHAVARALTWSTSPCGHRAAARPSRSRRSQVRSRSACYPGTGDGPALRRKPFGAGLDEHSQGATAGCGPWDVVPDVHYAQFEWELDSDICVCRERTSVVPRGRDPLDGRVAAGPG